VTAFSQHKFTGDIIMKFRRTVLIALSFAVVANGVAVMHSTAAAASGPRPNFQVPFICGQTWAGGTRTNHNPIYAIDFNHYDANGPDDLGRRVVASAGGTVDYVDSSEVGYGNQVVIRHGNGWKTRYAHLMDGSITVQRGQSVNKGQVIGKVGNSGNSYGAHLHYEQNHDGANVKAVFYGDNLALYFGTRNYNSPSC